MQASKKGVTVDGGFTSAKVVKADVVTCESTIIHVIDSVLLPCPLEPGELSHDPPVVHESLQVNGSSLYELISAHPGYRHPPSISVKTLLYRVQS